MASSSVNSSRNPWKPLPESFYARPTLEVARDLLGKVLWVDNAGACAAHIVETEAYMGDDPASHGARGSTPRSAPMFEDPGRAYVYLIYGMYEMLNFVTEPRGFPGAVLIRGVSPVSGHALMAKRRAGAREQDWTNGPGRLARALGIERSHNRASLQGPSLIVSDEGALPFRAPVMVSPRVGIRLARDRYWRFFIDGHPCVSPARENRLARPYSSPSVEAMA